MPSPSVTTRGATRPTARIARLWWIDYGGEAIDTEHAKVRHGKSSAFVVERKKLFVLRLVGQRAALLGQFKQVQPVGVANHRHDQAFIEGNSDSDVDVSVLQNSLLGEA